MFAGLTLFSTLAAAGIGAETGADGDGERPRAITVSGEAVVKVEPDTVILTFGVETWDKDIMRAKELNQEIVKKAFAVERGRRRGASHSNGLSCHSAALQK